MAKAMQLVWVFGIGAALAAGCSKKDAKPEPKVLGASGFVVDAPAEWTVKEEMKGFFSVESPVHHGGSVQVMVDAHAGTPGEVADAVKSASCADASKAIGEKTPAGTVYVQCEATIATIGDKAITGTRISAQLNTDKGTANCHIDTDHDVEVVAAVCKSLRRQ